MKMSGTFIRDIILLNRYNEKETSFSNVKYVFTLPYCLTN